MTQRLAHLAALSLLMGGLSGCGLALAPHDLPQNQCGGDSDCPGGGARCDTDRHMCIATVATPLSIGFSVLPAEDPLGGAPIKSVFAAASVSASTTRDLNLSPRMTVVGTVRFAGEPVPAEVRFLRPSPVPGAETLSVRALTLATPATAPDGQDADYSLRVAAGEAYDVVVQPAGDATHALPPMHVAVNTPEADLGRADLVYPDTMADPCGETRFEGCTFTGEVYGLSSDGSALPEDGLAVRAVDANTGEVVSSTASSGSDRVGGGAAEPGVFSVRIAPGASGWVLKITGSDVRSLFPTVIADPALFFPGSARPRVLVPRLRSVHYVGFVESASAQRLGNASVTFRASNVLDSTTQLLGSFHATVTSESPGPDGDPTRLGRFEADLLPGTYQVTVTPQSGNGEGVLVQELPVMPRPDGSAIMGQVFRVPQRAMLGGTLRTAAGDPMPGVAFSAMARGQSTADPAADFNRSNDTLTDGLGQFALGLDVGVYDLVAKPPPSTGFPWTMRRSLEIGAGDSVRSENLEVPAPIPVTGVVRTADGSLVAGARVTAIAVVPDSGGGQRAVAVGEAQTDESGRYEVLLPSSLR